MLARTTGTRGRCACRRPVAHSRRGGRPPRRGDAQVMPRIHHGRAARGARDRAAREESDGTPGQARAARGCPRRVEAAAGQAVSDRRRAGRGVRRRLRAPRSARGRGAGSAVRRLPRHARGGTIRSTWNLRAGWPGDRSPRGLARPGAPRGTFVTLLHVGPCDSIGAAYDTITEWIGAHDLAAAGPPREVYLSEPETPPELVRTIVELSVTEVATPVATG
jgi:hypothetical protein